MPLKFEFRDHFWKTFTEVPGVSQCFEINAYTDERTDPPAPRQVEVAGRLARYITEALHSIKQHAVEYCRYIDDAVGLADEGIHIDYLNIEQHFTIESAMISYLTGVEGDFYFLDCKCDWEEEHGMQLVMDGARVLGCGGHTGAFLMTRDDATYRSIAESYGG